MVEDFFRDSTAMVSRPRVTPDEVEELVDNFDSLRKADIKEENT